MGSCERQGEVVLSTDRLVLRRFREGDSKAVCQCFSDPEVIRYQRFPRPITEEEACLFVRSYIESYEQDPPRRYPFAIVLRDSGEVIGQCEIDVTRGNGTRGGIAFTVNRRSWGKGLGTEAVRALVGFGFDQLRLQGISASCESENGAAVRVLEKIGMKQQPRLRKEAGAAPKEGSYLTYSISEKEWRGDASVS